MPSELTTRSVIINDCRKPALYVQKPSKKFIPAVHSSEYLRLAIGERSSDGRMTSEKGGGEENIPTEDKIL